MNDNEYIAEFLDYKGKALDYHECWISLMPAVHKIEDMRCRGMLVGLKKVMREYSEIADLQRTHTVVVKFAKEHYKIFKE